MEWKAVTPEEFAAPRPRCEFEGNHTYRLAIEEGDVHLYAVEDCTGWNTCWRPESYEIEMASEYSPTFILKTNRECWHNYKPTGHGPCDCNFWVELVPVDPT